MNKTTKMHDRVISAILKSNEWRLEFRSVAPTIGVYKRIIYFDCFQLLLYSEFFDDAELLYKGSHIESFSKRKFRALWEELELRKLSKKTNDAELRLMELDV
jgi:hypothetical protein